MGLFGRRKERVLVIDDDEDLRATMDLRFSTAGYEVFQASGGEEGLKMAARVRPVAIILDVNMPGMDGYETCRRLRGQRRTRNIPVIMLTACRRVGELEEGLAAGADTYLTKPFDGPELVEEVRKIVESRREKRASKGSGKADGHEGRVEDVIVERLRAAPRKLGDVARVVPGILLGPRDDLLLADEKTGDEHRSILFEKDVARFVARRPRKYLKFSERVAAALCPDLGVFDSPRKVLVRRSAPPLVAALDTHKRLVDKTVLVVLPVKRKCRPELLLGVLSSKLASFAIDRVVERARAGVLPWIAPAELEALPVPGVGGLKGRKYDDRLVDEAGELVQRLEAGLKLGSDEASGLMKRLDRTVAEGFGVDFSLLENIVSPPTP